MDTPELRRLKDRERYHSNPERKQQVKEAAARSTTKHKQRYLALRREDYKKNTETYKENHKRRVLASPEKYILRSIKHSAKERNIPFDLTIEDIILPAECPVFNEPLLLNIGKGHSPFSYSVDRIDSSKGYIKGNIQIISKLANTMKQNATPEQLLRFASWVFETYKE